MKREKKYGPDVIPEKIYPMLHNISFTMMALFIGVIVFFAAQLIGAVGMVVTDDPYISQSEAQSEEADITLEKDLGHNYCGTFFIWQTVGNCYKSTDDYIAAVNELEEFTDSVGGKAANCFIPLAVVIIFMSMLVIFRKYDRKRFFDTKGWRWFLSVGISLSAVNLMDIYMHCLTAHIDRIHGTGIFTNAAYYCQAYNVLGGPALIFMTAFIMRQHTLNVHNLPTDGNRKALKILAGLVGAVGFGFMLVRFGTRVYELICYKTHDARLPFYFYMLDFPRELAPSPEAYRNVLFFRLIKDLPVFIASGMTMILLIKIMLSSAQDKINTPENIKRFNTAMIALLASSVIYNLLGLYEIQLINGKFSGIYHQITYTMGIRALADPIIFVLLLWWIKVFVQTVSPVISDDRATAFTFK